MANEKIVNRENLKAFRQAYNKRLENGQVVPLLTKDIKAISKDTGSIQETPFISQGTATENNTAPVDTGDYGEHLEKQGNSVVVNQGVETPTQTFSVSAETNEQTSLQSNLYFTSGTKILLSVKQSVKLTSNTRNTFRLTKSDNTNINETDSANANLNAGTRFVIMTISSTDTYALKYWCNNPDVNVSFTNFQCINLTQWFNGDIPQDLSDHPEHWSWYQNYGDYIAYNTGTLENSVGRYLVCGQGRNLWDEEWESGSYNQTTGLSTTNASKIRSKNDKPIRVIPNTLYHFKSSSILDVCFYDKNMNFIKYQPLQNENNRVPSNCWFIKFNTSGTSYNHDITISLYYSTGEGYDQYYPYVAPKVYDTGTEILRKAGSVKDTKLPSGVITRRIGVVDLSQLSWTYNSENGYFSTTSITDIPTRKVVDMFCNKYSIYTGNYWSGVGDKQLAKLGNDKQIRLYDSSLNGNTNLISGILYYELAESTTEQGTPFDENIEISDYSYMSWEDTNNALVTIPQGTKLFYPAWYVGFIDSLGQREDIDWNANNVASKTELNSVDTKHDSLYAIMQENIGGTLRQLLASSQSIDFLNTDWVDLGSLSWTTYSSGTNTLRTTTISGAKNGASGSVPKLLSTKYGVGTSATISSLSSTLANKTLSLVKDSNVLALRDDELTDTANLKGVLLAYEKAS